MATVAECERALQELAERLERSEPAQHQAALDRTLSCSLSDLGIVFGARLKDGQLCDIAQAPSADGQIQLTMTSDDLLAMVAGDLKLSSAWTSGRVKIVAGVRDLLKLRTLF